MTIQGLVAVGALAGSTLWANASDGPMRSTVMVCMERGSPRILGHARNLVTKMFAGIDIEISWWGRGDCPLEAIRIILKVATPPDEQPGALAYAFPYEGTHIVVFYDRIEQEVPQSRVPTLTAHVIAHEITHLLEGVNRHSQSGLMKKHWSDHDYLQMVWKPLPFAPEDVILIHRGLEMRSIRRAQE